jgi:SAM-dependent methyltransferase
MAEERMSPNSQDFVELLFHWHRYLAVVPWITGKHVVEIGFGNGYGSRYLANFAQFVDAVDVDSDTVDQARVAYPFPRLEFRQGGLPELPFGNHYADVVVFFEVLEHIDSSLHDQCFKEIARILKPNGLLLMSTPDHDRTQTFSEVNPYHVGEVNGAALKDLLGRYFPEQQLYYQEINVASLIWAPGEAAPQPIYGVVADEAGSRPAPPDTAIHLTLMAMASFQPLSGSLASACIETERVILNRLWNQIGVATDAVSEWKTRWGQAQEQISNLNQELQRMNWDNRTLSQAYLAITEKATVLQQKIQHYEGLDQELKSLKDQYQQLATQWEVVQNARSWRLIQRYWRFMDNNPLGRSFKKIRALMVKHPKDAEQ